MQNLTTITSKTMHKIRIKLKHNIRISIKTIFQGCQDFKFLISNSEGKFEFFSSIRGYSKSDVSFMQCIIGNGDSPE